MKKMSGFRENIKKGRVKPDKLALLQKVKKQTPTKKSVDVETKENEKDSAAHWKKLYKNLKSEFATFKKEQKEKMKANDTESKAEKALQKELADKKEELFETKQSLAEEKRKRNEAEVTIRNMQQEHKKLEQDYEYLKDVHEKTAEHMEFMKTKVSNYRSECQSLEDRHRNLLTKLEETEKNMYKYKKSRDKQVEKAWKLQAYNNSFLELQPDVVISYLYDSMSKKNISLFKELPLLNRQLHTIRSVEYLKRTTSKAKREMGVIETTPVFGHITKSEPGSSYKWRFISIDGISYAVVNTLKHPLQEGSPISAVVNHEDSTAIMTWVYQDVAEM